MSKIRLSLIQKISLVFAAVFLPFLFVLGYFIQQLLSNEMISNVNEAMKEVTLNEASEVDERFDSFELTALNSVAFVKDLLDANSFPGAENDFAEKYKIVKGALRTNVSAFKNKDVSGIFLSNKSKLTPEIKNAIIATGKGFDCYSKGVMDSFFNMYFISAMQFIRIYPKDWALEIESDHDFSKDLFFYVADPEHNPDKKSKWTPIYYDSIWKHWMTSVITPLYIDGEFHGIVGHDVILDDIYKEVVEKKHFKGGYSFIFDSEKNVVAHPKYLGKFSKDLKMGSILKFSSLDEKGLESVISKALPEIEKSGFVFMDTFSENGKKYIFYACKMKFLNWYFASVIPFEDSVGPLHFFEEKFRLGAILFSLILFISIILLLWFYVIRPISRLSKATEEIGCGNLDYRVKFDSWDEMGALSRSINNMAANLKATTASKDQLEFLVSERTKELEENKESLEKIVAERTKELEKINEELKKENSFRMFFERSSEAMLTLCDGRFIDCNQSAVKMLEAKDKSHVLNFPWELSPEFQPDGRKSSEKAKEMIQKALDNGSNRFEWIHKKANGESFPVEVSLTPVVIEGKTMFNSLWRDISDRKLAEQKLIEYQEHLEELVKARTKELEEINKILKQENTYKIFFESSSDAMFILDNGVFVDCNQSALNMFKLEKKEQILNTTPSAWSPEFLADGSSVSDERGWVIVNEVLKEGSMRLEWLHRRSDGEIFPAEILLTPISMEGKRYLHAVLRDVSDKKLAEQKVKEYQEHLEELVEARTKKLEEINEKLKKENAYRVLFESSADAMLIQDGEMFIDCNKSAMKMLRVKSKKEVMNTPPGNWIPPVSPEGDVFSEDVVTDVVSKALKNGSHRFEWYHRRADGEVFPLEVLLTAITIEGKEMIHVVWRDISDRKLAEKKIKEYQDHLEELVEARTKELAKTNDKLQLEIKEHRRLESDIEQILDASGDSIRVIDEHFNIVYVNKKFMEFSNLSEEELVGAHCFEVTPEKECHTEKCPLRRILNGETKVEKDVERRFGGSVMPCAMTCGPYTDSKGNLVGMVENYRDIRERVTAQEMAEKSALQQGRIEMSNNILHDIGNAAVGTGAFIIRLLSEKIWNERRSLERLCAFLSEKKDDIAKALGEEKAGSLIDFAEKLSESLKFRNELVLEQAEKISKSVGHINSVLNLQRQYAKEGVKTGGYVNIASLLENAVLMQSANFEKRDIKLKIKLQVGLPYSVPGDTTRLMQVVLNILKNACEAFDSVRDDRKRFLNVSAVKVGMDGGHLQIIFEDNAVGLSEDIKHKVFSRGFTTKETGSGIGLDQCRSIINSHDGKIWIESDGPDKGVSVIVELPLLRPEN